MATDSGDRTASYRDDTHISFRCWIRALTLVRRMTRGVGLLRGSREEPYASSRAASTLAGLPLPRKPRSAYSS